MADQELTTDQLDALAAKSSAPSSTPASAPAETPPASVSFPGNDELTSEQLDALDAKQQLASATAATLPNALGGPTSATQYAPTGLGPVKTEFSSADLDRAEASQLDDPSTDLTREQWDSAQGARKRLGGGPGFWSSAAGNLTGAIGDLFQTTYGAIKDLANPAQTGDVTQDAINATQHETAVANSWLQGVRNAGMRTMLGIQQAQQGWRGLVDGSADAGLSNATPQQLASGADAGYGNYLENNSFKREIENPTITSVPQLVSYLAPDDATGKKVQQALTASFSNPATAPLKNLTDAAAMISAPENEVAGAAGSLINKIPIGNLVKYSAGKVLQGLGSGTIVANDALDNVAKAAIDRMSQVTGLSSDQLNTVGSYASNAGLAGAGALGWSNYHNEDSANPLWDAMKPILGYIALRKGAAVVRSIGEGSQLAGTILREASDTMGPLRQDALGAVAANPDIPNVYRSAAADAVNTGGSAAIDSTPSRIANSTDYPGWIRRIAATANNPLLVGASRIAGSAVEGGAAAGLSMIPLTVGQSDEQAGATLGGAIPFGVIGGLASRVLGGSSAARNQDVARFLADSQLVGGDVSKLASLPDPRLQNLAALQGLLSLKGTDVLPLSATDFNKQAGTALANQPGIAPADVVPLDGTDFAANTSALGGRGAAGWFVDAPQGQRPRVFINLDAVNPSDIHEGLGHAILSSQVMDGAQRSDARNFVQQLYGQDGIEAMANEYAQRQLEAEQASLTQRAAAAGQPVPTFQPMDERIPLRVKNLSDNGMQVGDADPMDWARDEVFAEQMNQAGIDVNSIRRGLPANVDPDAATRNILAMNARGLEGLGARIDPQTGKIQGSLSSIFRDNPLIGSSPTLSKQLARYVQNYDGWLNGIDLGAKRVEGTQIAPTGSPYDMARSNLVNLRPVEGRPGVFENDFLRNDNGTVTFKSQKEVNDTDALRKAQLQAAIGTALRPASDPVLGPRMVAGKRVVTGSQLPATMGALKHFGPWIQSIANTFRNDAGQGGVYQVKYNRVGTGETGSYKVLNLGNIRSITRNFWEPFEYSMSKQGHLLAHVIDDSTVQRNVLKGINGGLLPYHNNDAAAVRNSLMKYLDNHKQGLPSENGIGVGKRNEINALLTSFSKNHRSINPLASNFGPQGVVRTLRMDRIEDMNRVTDQDKNSPTYGQPKAGFHFDYFKVNNNMMPDIPALPAYPGHGIDHLATRDPAEESTAIQPRGGIEHTKAVQSAISALQGGSEGSFTRPDIGEVKVMKGSDGTTEKSFQDANGLNGIITKRILRNEDPAEAVAGAITAAAIGKQVRARGGPLGRIESEHNGYRAVLSLAHKGDPKSWILTGYRKDDGAARESNNPSRYAPQGSGGRQAVVASSVQKLLRELKPVK